MVQIQVSKDGTEIETKIQIWALAQVADSSYWLEVILEKCNDEVVEYLNSINKAQNEGVV